MEKTKPTGAHRLFTMVPAGPFRLEESARFGFGGRPAAAWDGAMRLAFCVDSYAHQCGVVLRQDSAGVHAEVHGDGDLTVIERQVRRVLSLDRDATGFVAVGERDPVVARLLAAAPGLRPPLFYSAYEAAVWAVVSARRSAAQMQTVRARLSAAHGTRFDLAGAELAAWPLPEKLLGVRGWPGLDERKIERLHGVARAALDGRLDTDTLRMMPPDQARLDLQRLAGIGPFYSALIVIRALGHTDILPVDEPRSLGMVGELYGFERGVSADEMERIAESWRPWRTWVTVLVRAASNRLGPASPGDGAAPTAEAIGAPH